MKDDRTTEFGGIAGGILRHALSWTSLVTGGFLAAVATVMVLVLWVIGAPAAGSILGQVLIAFALSRIALNGFHGEWSGTVFSSAGGSWGEVAAVAGKYLTLTALWLVPTFIFGLKDAIEPTLAAGAGADMAPALPSGPVVFALIAYMVVSIVAPPIFLIVAVGASGIGELFAIDHWRDSFSGRVGDLMLLYAVYAGAVLMCVVLGLPILIGASLISWKLATLLLFPALAFVCGVSVDLLGRLCGFFAFGDDRAPVADETARVDGALVGAAPDEPSTAPAAGQASAPEPTSALAPKPTPDASVPPSPALPALVQPQQLIDDLWKRIEVDPAGALEALEDLRAKHAPHPLAMHARALMFHRAGPTDRAVEAANEALALLFEGGQTYLAADILKTFWEQREGLDLDREQVILLASVLARKGELTLAANVYALVLVQIPDETRAIKGILQIADNLLHKRQKPEDASRLYEYLLKHCPDSPLADFMRDGLDEARKRAAQSRAS